MLLDDQAREIFAVTDAVAERVRKIGGTTLRSIGHIARLQRVCDNDGDYVTPHSMLAELREDNMQLAALRCGKYTNYVSSVAMWLRRACSSMDRRGGKTDRFFVRGGTTGDAAL